MTLKNRIKAAARALRQKSNAELTLAQFLESFGISADASGPALSEATYFACLKVLSESIGKLPFRVLKRTEKGGVVPQMNHPYWRTVYIAPNRYMTATAFWTLMELCRNHYGNAYAVIDTSDPRRPQLWPMDPRRVTIIVDNARILSEQGDVYYRYTAENGGEYIYGSEEVLHFKSHLTLDGIVGISVREQLATTIQGQVKAQKVVNDLYSSGMTAKAVLQYTGSLGEPNTKALVNLVNEYAKADTSGRVIPIPVNFSLTPLNIKLADSQFLEIKQYTALQIAAAFGVKPSQIGDYSKSSYASAEAQQLSFLVDTLLYIVKGYGEELTTKLIFNDQIAAGVNIKAQTDVLLRADQHTQIQTYSTAVNSFLFTPNEAREKLDLPAVEGGDRLLGNGASIPIGDVGKQYTGGANG